MSCAIYPVDEEHGFLAMEYVAGQELALDLDFNFVNALWWQGVSYAGKGDFAKAIALLTKAMGMSDGPMVRGMLGNVYGRAGERGRAIEMIKGLEAMSRQRYVAPADVALIYVGLGARIEHSNGWRRPIGSGRTAFT